MFNSAICGIAAIGTTLSNVGQTVSGMGFDPVLDRKCRTIGDPLQLEVRSSPSRWE